MKVEIRIYKLFDTDLLSLYDHKYPMADMMKEAIIAYANGKPLRYYIDDVAMSFDLNHKKNVRLRFEIENSEQNAVFLLKSIKHGYRNSFIKALLRNCLVQQNLCCYFGNPQCNNLHIINAQTINLTNFVNLVPLSNYKRSKKENGYVNNFVAYSQPQMQPIQMFPNNINLASNNMNLANQNIVNTQPIIASPTLNTNKIEVVNNPPVVNNCSKNKEISKETVISKNENISVQLSEDNDFLDAFDAL